MPIYLPYLLLVEACMILGAFIFIVCNNFWILYVSYFKRKLKHSALTPNLLIHIICWWIVGFTGIICNLYVIFMWQPSELVPSSSGGITNDGNAESIWLEMKHSISKLHLHRNLLVF